MKTAVLKRTPFMSGPIVPLPNVATRRQYLHKVLDTALTVCSGLGVAAMLLFFLTFV